MYTPNSKRALERLEYRMIWEDDFRNHLLNLEKLKSVIICGDLNVAHKDIDLKILKQIERVQVLLTEERGKMTELLEISFVDSFRLLYLELEDAYSWWSYFAKSIDRNIGWRIDYFIISKDLVKRTENVKKYSDTFGSDHCTVFLILK